MYIVKEKHFVYAPIQNVKFYRKEVRNIQISKAKCVQFDSRDDFTIVLKYINGYFRKYHIHLHIENGLVKIMLMTIFLLKRIIFSY